MALEFLHADGDITEFVELLYEKGYELARRSGPLRDRSLSREDAVYAMQEDLHTAWGTYVICDPARRRLLYLDSCGPQAHPSKLGRQGRLAGRIAVAGEKDPASDALLRLIRNFFRRTYAFRRYNGAARMSCHFGPHYQKMETDFFADPRAESLCTGFLQLLCPAGEAEHAAELAAGLLDRPGIGHIQVSVRPDWADHGLEQVHIPFLYDSNGFERDVYVQIAARLCGSPVCVSSDHLTVRITNRLPALALPAGGQARCVRLLLARPWVPVG